MPLTEREPDRGATGSARNQVGLTPAQISRCVTTWQALADVARLTVAVAIDTSEAEAHCSRTRYNETRRVVILGADVEPGTAIDARSRMSSLACLAHEMSHAERHSRGYQRPVGLPDLLLDEAEASLNASFYSVLNRADRVVLVEDAQDRLADWLRQAGHRSDDHGD